MKKSHNICILPILKIISLFECIWLIYQPVPRHGLEFIWIIPLIYFLALTIWGNIYNINKGIGIKIYLIISIFRYLIQPFLISLSNGELNHRMPNADRTSYEIAIIIYVIECLIAFKTIHYYYGIETNKYIKSSKNKLTNNKSNFTILGWSALIIYVAILLIRFNTWFPSLTIMGIKTGIEKSIVLDASFFNVIKCFIFIFLLIKAKKKHNNIILLFAIIAAAVYVLVVFIYGWL